MIFSASLKLLSSTAPNAKINNPKINGMATIGFSAISQLMLVKRIAIPTDSIT
nr:MAG TPA: hypothetical protein [Bacteriophage sp.]